MNIKSYYTNTSVFKMNVYLDFMKIPIRFMFVLEIPTHCCFT